MHYLLIYDVGEEYVEKRALYRNEHLKLAWDSHERGEMILGGALANPIDKAILFFNGDSPEVAENFAKADPYVLNGLVIKWEVRQWNTVIGEEASNPLRSI